MLCGLPKPKNFRAIISRPGCLHLGCVEQRLIQSQILGGRIERQHEPFHAANRLLVGVYAAAAPWTIRGPDLD